MSKLGQKLASLMPSCKEAARLQSEAMDTRLTLLQRVGLRVHLAFCKWCARYARQIKFLRSMAGEIATEEAMPPAQRLSTDARERIKKRLASEKL